VHDDQRRAASTTFSVNRHTDVRIAFHWVREALLKPLRSGSKVIVISSGAAVQGSPPSGGYAGAKATRRVIRDQSEQEYLQQFGEPLTPGVAGAALVELVRADAATVAPACLLTSAGLQTLP